MAMFVGIVVGVAEVGVYAAYLRKVRIAKDQEKKLVERKEVVSLPADEGTGSKGATKIITETESEEIWGKGLNGGVRRRVQERWRKENDNNKVGPRSILNEPKMDGDEDMADIKSDAKDR